MGNEKKTKIKFTRLSTQDVKQHVFDMRKCLDTAVFAKKDWPFRYDILEQRFKKTFGGD